MFIDLISQENNLSINIKVAQLFGLNTAVYWAELLNILQKAVRKKKYTEDFYITLDREYIAKKTTVSPQDQLTCDAGLSKAGVIYNSETNSNQVKINVTQMVSLITSEDISTLAKLAAEVKKTTKKGKTLTKKEGMKANMRTALVEPDQDIYAAYDKWISDMVDNKMLTKAAVTAFVNNINAFTDRKEVKLKLIEIATVNLYKDSVWAINRLEKDFGVAGTRIGTPQKKVETVGVDMEKKF